jgi:bacillolysin
MTHVRMDRVNNGVKVFGEQVITHLGRDGKVSDITGEQSAIPADLGKGKPAISQKEALAAAMKGFKGSDAAPQIERVIAKGADGKYHDAYHVVATDLQSLDGPQKANFLIDASTGKEFSPSWN